MVTLRPSLVLMVRFVPWIFSTVPRILTGGLAGAWATATADTAAISKAARGGVMGAPLRGKKNRESKRGGNYFIYTARQRKTSRGCRKYNPSPPPAGFSFSGPGTRSGGLPCRHRLRRRGRLSDAHGEMDRALSARRVDRCSGPDHVAMVLGENGAVVRHREQGGWRQLYSSPDRREGGPGRVNQVPG